MRFVKILVIIIIGIFITSLYIFRSMFTNQVADIPNNVVVNGGFLIDINLFELFCIVLLISTVVFFIIKKYTKK